MRVLSLYATKNFKLIMEFENQSYRILDVKKFLQNEQGLLKDICNDINLFLSAELDEIAGQVRFSNHVDFDNNMLYGASCDLDSLMNIQE